MKVSLLFVTVQPSLPNRRLNCYLCFKTGKYFHRNYIDKKRSFLYNENVLRKCYKIERIVAGRVEMDRCHEADCNVVEEQLETVWQR